MEEPDNEKQEAASKSPSDPKKNNKTEKRKQVQPPKIHFEDGKGVVGKENGKKDNEPSENLEDDANNEEEGDRFQKYYFLISFFSTRTFHGACSAQLGTPPNLFHYCNL